jgi:hypothetical protein
VASISFQEPAAASWSALGNADSDGYMPANRARPVPR